MIKPRPEPNSLARLTLLPGELSIISTLGTASPTLTKLGRELWKWQTGCWARGALAARRLAANMVAIYVCMAFGVAFEMD